MLAFTETRPKGDAHRYRLIHMFCSDTERALRSSWKMEGGQVVQVVEMLMDGALRLSQRACEELTEDGRDKELGEYCILLSPSLVLFIEL